MNKFINAFDRIGNIPSLYISKQPRFRTLCGSITTLLLFLSIITMIFYFFIDFIIGSGMTVIYSKENLDEEVAHSFNKQVFMVKVVDVHGTSLDPKIAHLKAGFSEYNSLNLSNEPISLEPCSFNVHFPKTVNDELLNRFNVTSFMCLDPKFNFTLYSNAKVIKSSYLAIYIQKCINTTENDRHCFSDKEISNALTNATYYISLVFEDSLINHYNFSDNPFKRKIDIVSKPLSFDFIYDYYFYWKKVIYKSDRGFYYNYWKTYSDYQFDSSLVETVIHSSHSKYVHPGVYSRIQIGLHNSRFELYQRQFPKIQIVIANVSGVLNVLLYASSFIVKIFTRGRYYSQLITSLNENKAKEISSNFNSIKTSTKINRLNLSLALRIPRLNSQDKISSCTSLKWKVMPKLNSKTVYLTKCQKFIRNHLTLENILKKMLFVESISMKNNECFNSNISLSDLMQNKPIRNNNFVNSINSLMLSRNDVQSLNQSSRNFKRKNDLT